MQPDKNTPDFRPSDFGRGNGGRRGGSGRRKTPDREVPIFSPTGAEGEGSSELLNRWLDGDVPESALLATESGDEAVELWNKIHDEAELLRNRTTPLYVHKRIMDSLPDDLYQRRLPWYKRPISFNPMLFVVVAAGLLVGGAVVATLLMGN